MSFLSLHRLYEGMINLDVVFVKGQFPALVVTASADLLEELDLSKISSILLLDCSPSPRSFGISGPASSTAEEEGVQSHPLLQWSLPS